MTKRVTENLPKIMEMVQAGFSPQQIYKAIGGRKTELLKVVREIQGRPKPPDVQKYVPKKHRAGWVIISVVSVTGETDPSDIQNLGLSREQAIQALNLKIHTKAKKFYRYIKIEVTKTKKEAEENVKMEELEEEALSINIFNANNVDMILNALVSLSEPTDTILHPDTLSALFLTGSIELKETTAKILRIESDFEGDELPF